MTKPNSIDLVELPAADEATVESAKAFYSSVFGWTFTSYGPTYVDSADSGTTLGINGVAEGRQATPLAVLYVADLEATRASVLAAGGQVREDIYSFPGGRRFHFVDPAGNELAAWSE